MYLYRFANRAALVALTLGLIGGAAGPILGQTAPAAKAKVAAPAAPAAKAEVKAAPKPAQPAAALVNLNTATLPELEGLPGIGPVYAKAIVAARPFKSADELSRVKGLGAARIEALKPLIVVTPVSASPAVPAPAPGVATKAAVKVEATKPVATKPATGKKINLNTATKEELDTLPGIGPVKAQLIIDARPFKAIEDIMKIKGIKEHQFGLIKDQITVD